jgi:hypothetical protein
MPAPACLARTAAEGSPCRRRSRRAPHRRGPSPASIRSSIDQAVAMQDDGPLERVGRAFGAGPVLLDDLGADPVGPPLQRARHGKTDVAAADDDDPLLLLRSSCRRSRACGSRPRHGTGRRSGRRRKLVAGSGANSRPSRRTPTTIARRVEKRSVNWRSGVFRTGQSSSSAMPRSCAWPSRKLSVSKAAGARALQRGLGHFAFGADHHVDGRWSRR